MEKKTKQYRRNRPFTVNGERPGVGGDLVDGTSGVVNRSNGGQLRIVHARRMGGRPRASRCRPINAARGRYLCGGGQWKNQLRSYAKSGGRQQAEEKEENTDGIKGPSGVPPHASVRERPGGVAHLRPNGVTRSRASRIVYLGTIRARIAPGGPCRVTNIV